MDNSSKKPGQGWRIVAWSVLIIIGVVILVVVLYPPLFIIRCPVRRIDREPQMLLMALIQYKAEFGQFPSGDSRAICRALTGNNPKGIRFIEWRAQGVTPEGDLLDPWGTPYRIYFSGDQPLIRSAGKNRQFDSSERKGADDYFSG